MRRLLYILVFIFIACGPAKVVYDYDKEEDYTRYKTYNFFAPMDTRMGELDTRRAIRAIEAVLQEKGFQKVIGGADPDFYVNIKSELFQEAPSGSFGVGMAGTGSDMAGGVSVGMPMGNPTLKRMIFIDLVNVEQDALFWQARCEVTYEENLSPEKRDSKMLKVMEIVFSEFPPDLKN